MKQRKLNPVPKTLEELVKQDRAWLAATDSWKVRLAGSVLAGWTAAILGVYFSWLFGWLLPWWLAVAEHAICATAAYVVITARRQSARIRITNNERYLADQQTEPPGLAEGTPISQAAPTGTSVRATHAEMTPTVIGLAGISMGTYDAAGRLFVGFPSLHKCPHGEYTNVHPVDAWTLAGENVIAESGPRAEGPQGRHA